MRRYHLLLTTTCLILCQPANAQSVPSMYTSATRYDLLGRVTGTITPDPDGSGPLKYSAIRNSYDAAGNLSKVEKGELNTWQSELVKPSDWPGFSILKTTEMSFDSFGRKIAQLVKGSNLGITSITQYSYDALGKPECTVIRMNPTTFTSTQPAACAVGTQGSFGQDRITKNVYDASGRLAQVRKAVGTDKEQAYTTYSYTANGKQEYIIDANGNKAKFEYDAFDRLIRWIFPSITKSGSYNFATQSTSISTSNSPNSNDYEQYTYDLNDNAITVRKRDGSTIIYTYDKLNRVTIKDLPVRAGLSAEFRRDIYFAYDARGHQIDARFNSPTGDGIHSVYDGFGRVTSNTTTLDGLSWTLRYCYDRNGNRTRFGYAESGTSEGDCAAIWSNFASYSYDGLDRPTAVSMASSSAWTRNYTYHQRGLLASDVLAGGLGSNTFAFDEAGRLSSSTRNVSGTANDLTITLNYAPSNQISREIKNNTAYSFSERGNKDLIFTSNGLNQYVTVDNSTTNGIDASYCFDLNGNLTADGTSVYLYDIENRLIQKRDQGQNNTNCGNLQYTGTIRTTLNYDPLGRIYKLTGAIEGTTYFLMDGDALVAEYGNTGVMRRRYVHGVSAGVDDPIAWYEGNSLSSDSLRFLHADRQGSITLTTDSAANALRIYRYDEYGMPQAGDGAALRPENGARFTYTGQAFLPDLGLYYYKARMYSPSLGRFMQNDPIGYQDQINLYTYVGNDPMNKSDSSGLCPVCVVPLIVTPELAGYGIAAIAGLILTTIPDNVYNNSLEVTVTFDPGEWRDGEYVGPLISESTRPLGDLEPMQGPAHSAPRPYFQGLTDEELLDALKNPDGGEGVKVRGNEVRDGNGRVHEAQSRSGISPDTEIPVEELPEDEPMAPWEKE